MLIYVIGKMVKFNKKNFVPLQSRIFAYVIRFMKCFMKIFYFFGKIKVATRLK